jgi:hypothetical protein
MSAGLISGGALLILGATLPWLTLYAGLQQYSGMIGAFGWIVCGAGVIAIAMGILSLRGRPSWVEKTSAMLGLVLIAFAAWLFQGLHEITQRPDAVMLVPRPGPGLYVVLTGAIVIALGPTAQYVLDVRIH